MEILIGNLYSVRVSFSLAASPGSGTALRGAELEISLRLARAPGGRHTPARRDHDLSAERPGVRLMHVLMQVYFLVPARAPGWVSFYADLKT